MIDLNNTSDIAIIGMAGKFPKANNIREYWQNIVSGKECIAFLSDDELLKNGVQLKKLRESNFIKSGFILDNIDKFDELFFKYSPKEAIAMDPQHRLWLEASWNTLEDAGYNSESYNGLIGVYAGAGGSVSSYLLEYIKRYPEASGATSSFHHLGNDKDFMSTRASFKMDLKGPSVTVQTACSTSLVAVHIACQSLLNGECDMAIAGASTVRVPHYSGYSYIEGDILSSTGHCSAFDEEADGTVFGSGVGAVLLKPLKNALKDKDHIYAVIKGTAINNDGGRKNSYSSPSVEGQVEAITKAFDVAGVNPQTVEYMEAHGTGTNTGDPVEFAALSKAFEKHTDKIQYCAIGSVKNNIGHSEASAGIAGLMKIALALHHKVIPPTINCNKPNSKINFDQSPFYIQTQKTLWNSNQTARRAAVNALGMGGTNAFAVLEEAPQLNKQDVKQKSKKKHILTITAKKETALNDYVKKYISFLKEEVNANFYDICHTANMGRVRFSHRLAIIASNSNEANELLNSYLSGGKSNSIFYGVAKNEELDTNFKPIDTSPATLEALAQSFVKGFDVDLKILDKGLGCKKTSLPTYPFQRKSFWFDAISSRSTEMKNFHPLLGYRIESPLATIFESEFSIYNLSFLADHKVDENVMFPLTAYIEMLLAAALELGYHTNVKIEDVVLQEGLILNRGQSRECQTIINSEKEVNIFALDKEENSNSWKKYLSGKITKLLSKPTLPFRLEDIISRCKIEVDVKDHYTNLEKMCLNFGPSFKGIKKLWINDDYAVGTIKSPRDLKLKTEGFSIHPSVLDSCFQVFPALLDHKNDNNFIPVLPISLDSFKLFQKPSNREMLWSVAKRRASATNSDDTFIGDLWIFNEKNELLVEVSGLCLKRLSRQKDLLTYITNWHLNEARSNEPYFLDGVSVLFLDSSGLGKELITKIESYNRAVYTVILDDYCKDLEFKPEHHNIVLNPKHKKHFEEALALIQSDAKKVIGEIVYMPCLDFYDTNNITQEKIYSSQKTLCGSMLYLIQSIFVAQPNSSPVLSIITKDTIKVLDQQRNISFLSSSIVGFSNAISVELPQLGCKLIDIDDRINCDDLFFEIFSSSRERITAYRNGQRFSAYLERVKLPNNTKDQLHLSNHYTYLVTGGAGALGKILIEWLIKHGAKNIIILRRSSSLKSLEPDWVKQINDSGQTIRVVAANVSDQTKMTETFKRLKNDYPPIKGIFHLAGVLDAGSLLQLSWDRFWKVMEPKTVGTWNLHLQSLDLDLDFFIMFSSIASMLGMPGQSNYASGNAFLDGLAQFRSISRLPAKSISWGPWPIGMTESISEQTLNQWSSLGLKFLNSNQSLSLLNSLMAYHLCKAGVFKVDWEKYITQFTKQGTQQLFSKLVKIKDDIKKAANQSANIVSPYDSKESLLALLRKEIATALSVDEYDIDDDIPLNDLGLDSLMAVRIRGNLCTILDKKLPATLFFDYPTLSQLSDFLALATTQPVKTINSNNSRESVSALLKKEIAAALSVDEYDIDEDIPLSDLGLDSLMAVRIRGNLCNLLDKKLPTTLFFDYPTLNKLSDYLLFDGDQSANITNNINNSKESLEALLRKEIAMALSVDEYDIDNDIPLSDLGLDSLMAVRIRGNLCTLLDKKLPTTLFFDYPTLNKLSDHLFIELANKPLLNKKSNELSLVEQQLDNLSEKELLQYIERQIL